MRGLVLLIVSLALAGCAQTGEQAPEPEFGASVRHAIRQQTDFSWPPSFSTDGDKMLSALAAYRGVGREDGSGGDAGLVQVDGYYRDDGTYVKPHVRTRPDGNPNNNLSSD